MKRIHSPCLLRRDVLRRVGALAGAAALGLPLRAADAPGGAPLPRRVLGRTKLDVACHVLGTGSFGNAEDVTLDESVAIVNLALDLGVNCIDTAPLYKKAEEAVGRALGARRKEIVLATKVWADSVDEAEASLANSLKILKTDVIDILYLHSLGNRSAEAARPDSPVFEWLVKRRKAGACRFIGVTGHNLPGRFLPFLESGACDVALMNLNFADRHTYNFEERVLPAARKQDVGVIAMKVFGGPDPATGAWSTRTSKPLVGEDRLALAVRYALTLPGVAAVDLGAMTADQLRQNVELVRRFAPLTDAEMAEALKIGKGLAAAWGAHYGPVEEPKRD